MQDKFLIINKEGQIFEPKDYLKRADCPVDFNLFVQKEAFEKEQRESPPEKSEHLSYAKKLGFRWEPNSDFGFMSYDYKAALIMRLIKEYSRQLVLGIGLPIFEVHGANVFDLSHPVVEAYAKLYGSRLFKFKSGKKEVVMGYDASYPQFNLAVDYALSYKQLPFAHFSISDCYRHEQSGECLLLYRERRFYMPDVHPYFKNLAEAFAWYPKIQAQILQAGKEAKRQYQVCAEVSSKESWQQYQEQIKGIARSLGQEILIKVSLDPKPKYWIINVDYKIVDKLGQSREIACIQIDVNNAQRLGINYINEKGEKINPIIIHSAVPGGIERYLYMMLDNFKESFPLWLYPAQIRLIPVNDQYIGFCQKLVQRYKSLPVRIEIDDQPDSVGKKIKRAHEDLIPFPIVVGEKEAKGENLENLNEALQKIAASAKDKPFLSLSYPNLLSQQV